nr:MAG TPA: TIP49 AAA-lid domain [Bacteriophage sp.]
MGFFSMLYSIQTESSKRYAFNLITLSLTQIQRNPQ